MSTADDYRTWLRKFPKEPAARMATALAAVDAFENCRRKRRVTAADLRPLVLAASSPHKLVFETGCNLLVQLAARHAEAQACFLEMAKDKNATARFHAVAYLSPKLPEPLRLEIVGIALDDRNAKVRLKGIEGAEEFNFTRFLERLEEMQETEANEAVRHSLAVHIALLRDGFFVEPSRDGAGYYLTVRGPRSFGGPFIPKEKYSEEFVRKEVARLKEGNSWD
jgi:hypothetical protein